MCASAHSSYTRERDDARDGVDALVDAGDALAAVDVHEDCANLSGNIAEAGTAGAPAQVPGGFCPATACLCLVISAVFMLSSRLVNNIIKSTVETTHQVQKPMVA
jgi:hypothetical protein